MIKAIFCYLPFFGCALTFWTFLASVRLGVRARAIGLAGLLLCASKFVCFRAFGGDAFAPELPERVIAVWNWAYSGFVILFFLSLAGLVVRALLRRCCRKDCPVLLWLVLLPLLAWGLSVWGCVSGWRAPLVEEVELAFESLPAELDGYRILHISDIHASAAARRWRTERLVETANGAKADLICLTGDYADGFSHRQWRNIEPLGALAARDGVLAVTGNHEYYHDTAAWMFRYSTLENIRFLANESVSPRPGLVVGGVSDQGCVLFGYPAPDPDRAFAGADERAFRILLQHRPYQNYAKLLSREPEARWDLQLSGHTHGGIVPGFASFIALFNKGFVRGSYEGVRSWHDVLYVTAGAGQWAGFPLRFCNPPVMTLITLRRP